MYKKKKPVSMYTWLLPLFMAVFGEVMVYLWSMESFELHRFLTIFSFGLGFGSVLALIGSLFAGKAPKLVPGKHLLMIDDNAEVKEVCTGSADVGAFRYFGVRPDKDEEMEIILLEEYGDWERKNLDKNVNDIMEIISRDNWERDIWQKSKKETD